MFPEDFSELLRRKVLEHYPESSEQYRGFCDVLCKLHHRTPYYELWVEVIEFLFGGDQDELERVMRTRMVTKPINHKLNKKVERDLELLQRMREILAEAERVDQGGEGFIRGLITEIFQELVMKHAEARIRKRAR